MQLFHSLEAVPSVPLFGEAALEFARLTAEADAGRLPHALLISGPEGCGKATLARALIDHLLGRDAQARARIEAQSHSDLLVISRAFDAKKEEYAREITVEQARSIGQFLAMTAGEGAWRVVLVDGADRMNVNAANAILKILEEPPPGALLILVAHQAGRLLPTIRSRCRMVKIPPLSRADFARILRQHQPDLEEGAIALLGRLSEDAPGVALELHRQEAVAMYEAIGQILDALPRHAHAEILALAEQVASGKQHQNWQLFTRLALHWLARQAQESGALHWAEQWQKSSEEFALCEARHLDYKTAVISFFHALQPF